MDDPFDDLLNLEEQYYDEGYQQGFADGVRQSALESKLFGIEKGYEKFVNMGKLQARAKIWAARFEQAKIQTAEGKAVDPLESTQKLQPIENNARLEKHLTTLLALVDPSTLSLSNTDDDVGDFDDHLKRAQAKERIIERIIGEEVSENMTSHPSKKQPRPAAGDIESFGRK